MTIYEITIDSYKYVGSTKQLPSRRKNQHLRLLKTNKHFNPFLQIVYNKYNILNYKTIYECVSLDNMKEEEENHIKIYKEKYGKMCMNVLTTYGGGSEWRKYKTKEELKILDYNRTNFSPEQRKQMGIKQSKTIQSIPITERQDWYDRGAINRAKNIKQRKNYTPIIIDIIYPDGEVKSESYDTESLFFKNTNLEETSLRELKNNGEKKIKKRLYWTRHNYPVGTILKLRK
jgi:hypothetical protein